MNVFKKLQEVVGKKEKNYSGFDEVVGRERNISIGDIDKLKVNDLVDIIKKYDAFVIKIRKESESQVEFAEKFQIVDSQFKCKVIEYDELNQQLEKLQKTLNAELAKNINLTQSYDLAKKQNEHLKKQLAQATAEEKSDSTTSRVVIDADSELLLFISQEELQQLRDLFEQLKADSDEFLGKLQKEDKNITDQEAKKRAKNEEGKQKKKEEGEEGEEQEENEEEEEEEEEELTLEEMCGNTWDSLLQLNEQLDSLLGSMKAEKDKKNNSVLVGKEVIANLEAEIANKQKQIDVLISEKEKALESGRAAVKDAKQAESEMLTFNERLMEERVNRAELEDRVNVLSKQIGDLNSEREQLIVMVKAMNEEKLTLKNEISKVQDFYTEEDSKAKEEIEELSKELDELTDENEQLKTDLQKTREDLFLKIKELDNKDRQEKLKASQTTKDMQKLEGKVIEAQEDLNKQVETNHETMQRLKGLEEKRIAEKSKMKALKDRAKVLQEELSKKKLENANDLEQKNKQLDELEEEVKALRSRTNLKDELTKLTLDKDLRIANLEIQLTEAISNSKESKELAEQLQTRIDEEFTEKLVKQEQMIKSLSEKRELGLQEIQKLNTQIEMMKQHSNPTTQAKIVEIQNLLDKASSISQSNSSLVDAPSNSAPGKFTANFRTQSGSASNKSANGAGGSSKTMPSQPVISAQDEMKYLNDMKKEMEGVYKEYITIAFDFDKHTAEENHANFMKLEKKINLSIKKAQDLMDTIEDNL